MRWPGTASASAASGGTACAAARARRAAQRGRKGAARLAAERVGHDSRDRGETARACSGRRGAAANRGAPGCRGDGAGAAPPRPGPLSSARPRVHHDDAVGDAAHEGEVVGDEEDREVALVPQLEEQVHDLGLDRDVEGRGRLVGDRARRGSEARARAIMTRCSSPPENWWGKLAEPLLRPGDVDLAQQLERPLAHLPADRAPACGSAASPRGSGRCCRSGRRSGRAPGRRCSPRRPGRSAARCSAHARARRRRERGSRRRPRGRCPAAGAAARGPSRSCPSRSRRRCRAPRPRPARGRPRARPAAAPAAWQSRPGGPRTSTSGSLTIRSSAHGSRGRARRAAGRRGS